MKIRLIIYINIIYILHNVTIRVDSFINLEINVNISDLFERKTNTNYYIYFNRNIFSYVTFKLGEHTFKNTDNMIYLDPNIDKLNIVFKNDRIISNYIINYIISIDETYSSQCSIILTTNDSSITNGEIELIEESNDFEDDTESYCYILCAQCDMGPSMIRNEIIISQNYISCKNGYHLMFET